MGTLISSVQMWSVIEHETVGTDVRVGDVAVTRQPNARQLRAVRAEQAEQEDAERRMARKDLRDG